VAAGAAVQVRAAFLPSTAFTVAVAESISGAGRTTVGGSVAGGKNGNN